jgi:hypothetical protein
MIGEAYHRRLTFSYAIPEGIEEASKGKASRKKDL